jgi:hypothetical protein
MNAVLVFIRLLSLFMIMPCCGMMGQNLSEPNIPLQNDQQVTGIFQNLQSQQLMQGKNYQYLYPGVKGHQFWGPSVYQIGTVTFEGIHYHDILLNYDAYNGLLVTPLVQNGLTKNIYLDNSRIDGFLIQNQSFVNIRDSLSGVPPGFYIVAFQENGKALYIHAAKTIQANTGRPGEPLKKFSEQQRHTLVLPGASHVVTNKKEVYEVFRGNPDIMTFIKSSRLKFKKPAEFTSNLIRILNEYQVVK